MKLTFINETGESFTEADFQPFLEKAIKLLDISEEELELVLINDIEMQRLNKETRGKDSPTDVLSFAYREVEGVPSTGSLGQIFISIETAAQNAAEMGQSLKEELQFLFIHGVLHCVGYDHETPEEEEEMKTMAYKILGRS